MIPVVFSYFRRRFADLATFFSVEPPDFLPFLLPVDLPPTAFLIFFSIPAICAVTLPSKSFCYPRFTLRAAASNGYQPAAGSSRRVPG